MVRHLIYYREARVIDVPRIQNFYAISPLFDLANLPGLSTSWSIRFPTLPPLVSFLAKLSSALKPFSVQCRKNERQLCLDALIWLLRHQVVLQMHVRLRLVAREEAKRQAAELRKAERTRIFNQQQKRLAREMEVEKKRASAEDIQARVPRPTSALSLSAPIDVTIGGEALERGRLRDRSASPRPAKQEVDAVLTSALSATRPDPPSVSKGTTQAVLSNASSSVPSVTSLADKVEELKFERRPVLRSRSPSRILATASERSLSTRRSGSRPSTPRGRSRPSGGHSRESSTSLAVDVLQQGLQQQQQQQQQSAPLSSLKHRSSRREGRAANSSRSPSRARMRVTGFGEGEEVFVEIEGAAEGNSKETSQSAATAEEGRRLSRVGEEGEAESIAHLSERKGALAITPEHASNDEREEDQSEGDEIFDEEEIEEAVDIEEWEINPKASIITEPSRAGGEENEWIAVMVQGRPPWLTQRLFKCVSDLKNLLNIIRS